MLFFLNKYKGNTLIELDFFIENGYLGIVLAIEELSSIEFLFIFMV